jgi:putative methylase
MHSKKALAVALSRLSVFATPRADLEQYPTESELAAELLWTAQLQGDINGKHVLDLGCGTGILGIGALLLGASHVTFVDIDAAALKTLKENLAGFEGSSHAIVQADVTAYNATADTTITNPPFGTRRAHADLAFLAAATCAAPVTYSIHKTSTVSHLLRWCQQHDLAATTQAHRLALRATMAHHTRHTHRIDVSLLRVVRHPSRVRTNP